MPKTKSRGFTLIELLVVVVILIILTLLGFVSFTTAQRNARDAKRKGDLQSVRSTLQKFYSDFSAYPNSLNGFVSYDSANCTTSSSSIARWGDGSAKSGGNANGLVCNSTTYARELPEDPLNRAPEYCYEQTASGQNYNLYARLEGRNGVNVSPAVNCGGSTGSPYNYLVTAAD